MTETFGTIINVTGTEILSNSEAIGQLIASVETKVIDDNKNEPLKG